MRNRARGVNRQGRYFPVFFTLVLPAVAAEAETRFFGFFGCLAFFALAFCAAAVFSLDAAPIRSAKLRETQVA